MRSALSSQSRRELVQQMAPRYQEASRAHKILLLDAFVAITGYVRKYAIQLLNHPEEPKPRSQMDRMPAAPLPQSGDRSGGLPTREHALPFSDRGD